MLAEKEIACSAGGTERNARVPDDNVSVIDVERLVDGHCFEHLVEKYRWSEHSQRLKADITDRLLLEVYEWLMETDAEDGGMSTWTMRVACG